MRFVDYQRTFDNVQASTLGEALAQVESLHPNLRMVVRDGNGQLRQDLSVLVNGEPASSVDTPLRYGDDVEFSHA